MITANKRSKKCWLDNVHLWSGFDLYDRDLWIRIFDVDAQSVTDSVSD